MPDPDTAPFLVGTGILLLHLLGIIHVIHALMTVRTAQGTIAWMVSLIAAPWVAIPLYWIAGRSRFSGYVRARRSDDADLRKLADEMHRRLRHYEIKPDDAFGRAAEILGGLPFTRGNELTLLIDGEETFEALFTSILSAEKYLLINFFIVKNDRIGTRFKDALVSRAKAGVKVYFLFDEIGSHKLSRSYLKEMEDAGIQCYAFGSNRHWWSRLQINFRNHRKIVVVDGEEAFIGGINVGDEYLGRDQRFGAWRDTHLKLRGPSVQAIQLVFIEDWNWAADDVPADLNWSGHAETADQIAAIIPTGPADPADSWQLVVAEAANTSRERLWIASPYFVPDGGVLTALQAAAIRGADVRILIPEKADHLLVWLSAFTYFEQTIPFGVKLYRYKRGFLHQKVMLVDDQLACVGTANLDNRSFRLNFEISGLSSDKAFIEEVAHMLELDFENSEVVKVTDFTERKFGFRLACRAARLMAPVQ
ncbi:cardiolipin synthase [Luteolibacter luteus]|uniref:Cardiolipin synthase n=1 Tax=Luteolibacter luteus TaxID=2728835 RepID=A0A858RKI7_9BACT|nr:cardiolipin synthase [Luteolibacter luteus]QJE97447.1 cardiolipin synthase [Luteolibacter luteus]